MTFSPWILLRMRNVSNKTCREKQHTQFMFNNFFRQLLWNNVEKCGRASGCRWQYGGVLCAGLIRLHTCKHMPASMHPPTYTHTHAHARVCTQRERQTDRQTDRHTQKYVILIAFPQQRWFCECTSVLCYMYVACLVIPCSTFSDMHFYTLYAVLHPCAWITLKFRTL